MYFQRNAVISASRALLLPQEFECTASPGHLRPQWLRQQWEGEGSRNVSRAWTKVTTPNSPIRSAKGSAGSSHRDPGISLLPWKDAANYKANHKTSVLCVWERRGFQVNSAKFDSMDTTAPVLLELCDPQPPEPFSLYPKPEMLLCYLTHWNIIPCKPQTAHQECFGCAGRQNPTDQHKEERHKLLSARCCLNSLWSHFSSCRWIIEDFSDSCSLFITTERSLNDFLVWAS